MSSAAINQPRTVKVLFVCLGNICRSPTAEGVFRHLVEQEGLTDRVIIDSAGTGEWHIGAPPDARACRAAAGRGYDLTKLRARQVIHRDFKAFDYIIAMDEDNVRNLKRLAPREHGHKIRLFTEFGSIGASHVPDPYAGGSQGFELVLDLIEDAAQGLLRQVRSDLGE
jgi:protein-tyrosine phosphatase